LTNASYDPTNNKKKVVISDDGMDVIEKVQFVYLQLYNEPWNLQPAYFSNNIYTSAKINLAKGCHSLGMWRLAAKISLCM